jgi:hypothetical protein
VDELDVLQEMKAILATAAVLFAILFVRPVACAEELTRVDSSPVMINMILTSLKGAQTVVICSFKLPAGIVVAKVIRGNRTRVGDLMNYDSFPKKPILAYERTGDHLGDGIGVLLETGYFELDQSKNFVVLECIIPESSQRERVLVPLDDIIKALTKKNAEQDASGNRR